MTEVIIVKFFIVSVIWTGCWLARFTYLGAEPSRKNLLIVFAPWIILVLYFLIFWWG